MWRTGPQAPSCPWHCLTSRSSPTCTVRISPVCSSMLKNSGLPCSRMENLRAALSVSGSSASVASALVTKVPEGDREKCGQLPRGGCAEATQLMWSAPSVHRSPRSDTVTTEWAACSPYRLSHGGWQCIYQPQVQGTPAVLPTESRALQEHPSGLSSENQCTFLPHAGSTSGPKVPAQSSKHTGILR